ncbi:hypothetical protein [Thalassoroseus pseudoceratinae]|uniref:hypothetical protein n=1 Tax=Thalassoroseus pseudoceratinae TaxID=2713176 RepID=UPI001422BEF5|nr:hypothetical protein [Thalassoroseus pseudoceratinae]
MKTGLLALCVVVSWADVSIADRFVFTARVEKQEYCPVYTSRRVFPGSRVERYQGIKIYFSSDDAARRFLRDTHSYLDKKTLPQLKGLNLPVRPLKQQFCPINPTRRVSILDPVVIYDHHQIHLFDQHSVRVWNRNPDKYADPEILVQLKKEPSVQSETSEDDATDSP